ncbi:helix-turn-helix domain-containing protein [Streptomyces sp. NPDC060020]|uniref:helix-turn-helix domain-containing protein n=1 Tax=Streptomyces sp. NPDC060020 TaxID=3347038 RepID=UPI00367BD065
MAEPVRVRRLTDQEGQKLQQIVRRGSTSSVRYRCAMMLLASAGGNRVPVIAQLVQADEDTVRDVIHRFNEIGLALAAGLAHAGVRGHRGSLCAPWSFHAPVSLCSPRGDSAAVTAEDRGGPATGSLQWPLPGWSSLRAHPRLRLSPGRKRFGFVPSGGTRVRDADGRPHLLARCVSE